MNKLIMIIAGTKWQIPLIKKIHEIGHKVLVVNLYPDSPAFSYADYSEIVDILDKEACLKIAQKYNKAYDIQIIERKPELAQNTANGNDLLVYHRTVKPEYDYYFQLFATAPYLQPDSIIKCANGLLGSDTYDSCFTAVKNNSFYWFCGVPVNYHPGILPRSQDMEPVIEETTGMYGITAESLDKYRCRIGRKPFVQLVSKFEAVDINTEDDLRIAEYIGHIYWKNGGEKHE